MARRELARRLVGLRETAGLKQAEAASAIGIAKAKLQYLEYGDRAVKDVDLEAILTAYDVPGADRDEWGELAILARAKGWWDAYDDTDLRPSAKRGAGYEWGARRLRVFTGTIVPALLQTADYTEALLRTNLVQQSPEQMARSVEVRRTRQEVLTHLDPIEYHAVIDEAALHRQAGGPTVIADQLHHMADVAGRLQNVTLRVVPWDAGLYAAQSGVFTLMDFGLPNDPGILQVEPALVDPTHVEDRQALYVHSRAFEDLLRVALGREETLELLRSVASQ